MNFRETVSDPKNHWRFLLSWNGNFCHQFAKNSQGPFGVFFPKIHLNWLTRFSLPVYCLCIVCTSASGCEAIRLDFPQPTLSLASLIAFVQKWKATICLGWRQKVSIQLMTRSQCRGKYHSGRRVAKCQIFTESKNLQPNFTPRKMRNSQQFCCF